MSLVVVLTDANVLYSRVLRDYFMYAAQRDVIQIRWSREILDEMSRNLVGNGRMSAGAASLLEIRMNAARAEAMVTVTVDDYEAFADLPMDDPGDRHVVAAAVAADADCICTDNVRHFPAEVMERVGIDLVRPGALLVKLFAEYPEDMLWAHQRLLHTMPSTTDERTIGTLRRSAGNDAADALRRLLGDKEAGQEGADAPAVRPAPQPTPVAVTTGQLGTARCQRCGRMLRSEDSIARGLGPFCARKS